MRAIRLSSTVTVISIATLAACADGGVSDPLAPQASDPAFSMHTPVVETCATIDFNGFAHGGSITQVSVLGFTLSVTVAPFATSTGAANPHTTARAFDTNQDPRVWEDGDLLWDPYGSVPSLARCPGCSGLDRILVIEDDRGWEFLDANGRRVGDSRWGGDITLSGFAGHGDLYIKRWTAIDNDASERPFQLWVGASVVGESSSLGDGSVQVVTNAPHTLGNSATFRLGRPFADRNTQYGAEETGSGGIDNIEVCRRQLLGDEGCTPGYWRNHTGLGPGRQANAWAPTGYSPGQLVTSVFGSAAPYVGAGDTLLDALQYGGGAGTAGGARILLRAAVAALLNAAHPAVDYPRSAASVISDVNAALASNNRNTMLTLAEALDADNNRGCPLS